MTTQDRTLDRYQELMQINAAAHVLRSAKQTGVFDELRRGQRTIDQLADSLKLQRDALSLLLDSLIAMNVIERYGDDNAVSPVMRLLCEYDNDLGDSIWDRLNANVKNEPGAIVGDVQPYLDSIAATQWIHTPAAMQVAEILDLIDPPAPIDDDATNEAKSEAKPEAARPLKILDLGCGSAVWSCAIAFGASAARIVAVDNEEALAAAGRTAESINLGVRFLPVTGDAETAELPSSEFDIVIIAQRLHSISSASADRLLEQAKSALVAGGRIVVIDLFRGPTKPRLSETIEALRIHLETPSGRIKTIKESEAMLVRHGFTSPQFSFIAASRINLGLMVATKP